MFVASIKAADELGPLVGSPGETLTATLKRTITEMILFGFFPRDARLYPHELAARFRVSQTPVREALMQLASEGLIEATPRRGFHIKPPTAAHVRDVWQVRLGLEQMAAEGVIARLSAGTLDDGALARIADVQRQRDALGPSMTTKQHIETNTAFHRSLVELSGNRLLGDLFGAIQMQLISAWIQRGVESWRPRLVEDGREHRAIIAALQARDVAACRAVLASHVGRSLDGALEDLQAQSAAEKDSNTDNAKKGGMR